MFWRDHPDAVIKISVLSEDGQELQSLKTEEVENNDHPVFNEILSFEGYMTNANYSLVFVAFGMCGKEHFDTEIGRIDYNI